MRQIQLSGEACWLNVKRIWESDHFGDFRHFEETSRLIADELSSAGCIDVERLELRADGKTAYGDWVIPRAWDLRDASLKLLLPDGSTEKIANFAETPLCVMMFSANTEEKIYPMVWYEKCAPNADLCGKLLYTNGAPKRLVKEALRREAAGIVSDWFPTYSGVREENDDMEGASRWENDLFYPRNDTALFGFSVSVRSGERIRNLLAQYDEISALAYVDSRSYDGSIYTVSGLLPGSGTDEEILLCGHLYEPGANDNATGCAMIIELAKALHALQPEGKRRGVRFVMGYEAAGMSGYAALHADRMKRTIAALNLDMVGAAKREKAKLHIWQSTLSCPAFGYSLILDIARERGIEFVESGFEIGDCLIADPTIGVPCISFVEHPARSYHSSMDTPDLVDPEELKRIGELALEWTLIMTEPTADDVKRVGRLLETERKAILADSGNAALPIKMEAYEKAYCDFEAWGFSDALSCVPKRVVNGPAVLGGRMREICPEIDPYYSAFMNTLLFHTDGKRTLRSIIRRSYAERGASVTEEAQTLTLKFFQILEENGIVTL